MSVRTSLQEFILCFLLSTKYVRITLLLLNFILIILALFLGGFLRPQKNGPDYWVGPSPRKEIRFYIISFTTFHHLGRFFYIARKDDKSVQELQQKRLSAAATNLPEESCPNKTQFKNQILNKLKTVSVLKIRLHESLLWVWPYLGVLGVFKKVSFYG